MKISLSQAAELLLQDNVVAIPTETVYGLAGSLHSEKAIREIFTLKGRPADNPLIIHLASVQELHPFVSELPPCFDALADAFWPGPLTMIMPASNIHKSVSAGLPTAAFRLPSHPLAIEILKLTGPLAIPSANLSGKPSSTSFLHVERDFGENFPVLDGGICEKGVESTILIFKDGEWQIARLGAISAEDLHAVLSYVPRYLAEQKLICPGQHYRHYAPKAKLFLDNHFANASLILGFSDRRYSSSAETWHLGSSQEPQHVAKELYRMLRELDLQDKTVAWIDMDFPQTGLWKTIRERLIKAAS